MNINLQHQAKGWIQKPLGGQALKSVCGNVTPDTQIMHFIVTTCNVLTNNKLFYWWYFFVGCQTEMSKCRAPLLFQMLIKLKLLEYWSHFTNYEQRGLTFS